MSDLFRLDGKLVAVIGAGSGIGEAVARGAAAQGAHVFCLDVAAPAAFATAERIRQAGGRADGGAADVTNRESLDATLDHVADAGTRLDAVVCTPGVNVRKRLVDYTEDEFDRVVRVNLKGTFNVLRSAGCVCQQEHPETLGVGRRDGGPDAVSDLGCGKLRHRFDLVRGRRLAGSRRTLRAARHVVERTSNIKRAVPLERPRNPRSNA
jgi:NAD(P)-dependent dehydrogenase (short-subunit alcohol dehydrogenase family)